ncbi:conserved hypothetical protein [Candidatus Protochlamydia naegleriophila]|uniref:Uncharacterized protein n=1 Tax=Candidatus Protochlamydia naegleriophila TaxID=389348 RepID=A0A0U5EPK2_9BACT|nr:hypothetical protein [Candidatus Protochlamydia naegleriophila]CUI15984.1 conserved hypothetical protein [Candidatus Protochlamydia naegleriophila]
MNAPPTGYGFSSSPTSPDYVDLNSTEKSEQLSNTQMKQGAPTNPGVILTTDSLEVPIEVAFGINSDKASSSKPSLLPLFRTRYVEDRQTEDLSLSYYQERLNSLTLEMQQRLNLDKSKPFEERDPDLIALDNSLKFEAHLMALAGSSSVPGSAPDESTLIGAQQYLGLPDLVKQELLNYGLIVTNFLDDHLTTIGPNDPSYDLLLNVSNQLKEAMQLFRSKVSHE